MTSEDLVERLAALRRGGFFSRLLLALGLASAAEVALGQAMATSTLFGHVSLEDGRPLAQVRVVATAPSLQGERSTTTTAAGDYRLALLPAGDYLLRFEASGFETVRRAISLASGGSVRLDLAMPLAVAESVRVVAQENGGSSLSEPAVAANFARALVERLPGDRTLRSITLLAPGVTDNGPTTNTGNDAARPGLMISGAPSYDSLFLVDGVVVQDNQRGQPHDLFVEDAIAETRIETARIAAEHGRFTGGVVQVVTRSGGNEPAGSLRVTLTNDRWTASDPYQEALGVDARADRVDAAWEATLGGPLLRDRLWLFAAGRLAHLEDSRSTSPTPMPGDLDPTPVPYRHGTEDQRFTAKLTSKLTARHTLVASAIDHRLDETGSTFNPLILDTAMLVPVDFPSTLLALHYGGVLSDRILLEAQYSRRRSSVEQGGAELSDRIRGTWILDRRRGARFHSPVGRPGVNRYDTESFVVRGSWLVSTERHGSHDLRAGVERLENLTRREVPFSGSDFSIRATRAIVRGTEIFPVFGFGTLVEYAPILQPNQGARFATDSFYLDDRMALGRRWTLRAGLRYDRSDDRMGDGFVLSRTDSWSPRLALVLDPLGDGRFAIDAGYARYRARNQDAYADSFAGGGTAARFSWAYEGPCINCDLSAPTASLQTTEEALALLFSWFDSIGGVGSPPTLAAEIPGFTLRLQQGRLRAPSVLEYSLGTAARLGTTGFLRADLVYREWRDFAAARIAAPTGKTPPDPYYGRVYDLAALESSNELVRSYRALQAHFSHRLYRDLSVGGSYTWSRLEGNFTPEIRCCGPQPSDLLAYPEYTEARWNRPRGELSSFGRGVGWPAADQRHRARVWLDGSWTLALGRLSATLLESVDSGHPFEAVGSIDPRPYVENPGYVTPPARVAYFFSPPAAFRTETVTQTDVALVWTIPLARGAELFLRPEVSNLFDEQGVIGVDTTVLTALDDRALQRFDPFHEAPVEGTHYRLGPHFGHPVDATDYQPPRTFRLAVGARF